ncbi:MAG: DUF5104 domain-containing protein [Butyrivibrio sp.]|nr:DUF5104 domain-containing protein [Muribaculum sp.]MCM1552184.1 DUF5104 domain-containing protein [Butyrivibrio sp.]
MQKNRIILGLSCISIFITLTGCASSAPSTKSPYIGPEQVARLQSEAILQGVLDKDAEAIANLFCPYMKENYPNLEEDIEIWIDFIDGDILSYDAPKGAMGSGTWTAEDGLVEGSINGRVENVKTSSGKTYRIGHGGYSVYKEHPDYVGVTSITIFVEDLYDYENHCYLEGGKCIIYLPEMYE